MDRKEFIKLCGYGLAFLSTRAAIAKDAAPVDATTEVGQAAITLPKPQLDGGKPLMQVLSNRKSSREFTSQKLSPQVLSNLLWAAFGVNRPEGKRTAPSSHNVQDIDIYVALAEGTFVYNASAHRLDPVVARDLRAATGTQSFVGTAPLNLIYVADLKKAGLSASQQQQYVPINVGFIGQNVYLFCASEGLATVFRGSVNANELAKLLKLRPDQKVLYSQTVGYPKA